MALRLRLLVIICTASYVLGQRYDDHATGGATHGAGGGATGGGGGSWAGGGSWGNRDSKVMEGFIGDRSHICQTHFNVQVKETTYPTCSPEISCQPYCHWSWTLWRWTCSKDSCCDSPKVVMRVETRNMTVCCDGYTSGPWGQRCTRPICSNKCSDNKTTCTAPNTCGPACYPACRNGGTCQDGTPNNTCTCTTGWMGPACDMAVQCTATGANVCQNGGVCTNGRCGCAEGYVGNLCDQALCTSRCLNDGICTAPDTCQCVNGFSGANCELPPTGGATP